MKRNFEQFVRRELHNLKGGQQKLEDGQQKLEGGQQKLEGGQQKLEGGQQKLDRKLNQKIDAGQAELKQTVSAGQITTTQWMVGIFIGAAVIVVAVATLVTTMMMVAGK